MTQGRVALNEALRFPKSFSSLFTDKLDLAPLSGAA